MPSIPKLRRTWFALLKEIEQQRGSKLTSDDRHDIQEAWTGKASQGGWTKADYDTAIGGLQRAAGQHNDQRAHVCEDEAKPEPGDWCTEAQAKWIVDLCDQIDWHKGRRLGPALYCGSTVLRDATLTLRYERLRQGMEAAATRAHRISAWRVLTRKEASNFIKALKKAAQEYPLPKEPADVS